MDSQPLAGTRIVSFEQYGAAPYATLLLAGLGAEILKIENDDKGGDDARAMAPLTLGPADSLYFQCFNLGKKSVCLNIKRPEDRAVLEDMVRDADAVVNNLRGSLPAKLGLDYAGLKQVKPSIVCGHISAYGRNNSRADWPGYDFLMQAEAGIMSLTGEPGGPPARIGLSMIDYMSGVILALGVVSAIQAARRTGTGMDVDVSLFGTALHQLAYQGTWYLNEGLVTGRTPRAGHPTAVPTQLFPTADGWVSVCCMKQKFWTILIDRIARPDLGADPRFAAFADRSRHRDELTPILDDVFATQPTDHWVTLLSGHIPVAPVFDLEQALDSDFVREIGMIEDIAYGNGGSLRMLSHPIEIDGRRAPRNRGPKLGEHTEDVRRRSAGKPSADGESQ